MDKITVIDANEHNLSHVSVELPRDKLIVFTGVSGSGKSSLAFDTIFAEGQRRYVESLNAYARQFIGQFDKPNVESIEGLSPTISIDQKSTSRSPRSTVGTVTEIYDYLRVLYARIGIPYCPECQREITPQSAQNIVEKILDMTEGTRLQILSPVIRGRKGTYNALFKQLRKEGFTRIRIDGTLWLIEDLPDDHRLEKTKTHHIDVVMDRIVIKHNDAVRHRLSQAVENALKKSGGYIIIQEVIKAAQENDESPPLESFYSQHLACPNCDITLGDRGMEEMAPRLFSFNSPYGACPSCEGLGVKYEISESLLVPDSQKNLLEGAIVPFKKSTGRYYQSFLKKLAKKYNVRLETPFKKLRQEEVKLLLYGDMPEGGKIILDQHEEIALTQEEDEYDWFDFVANFDGVMNILKRRYLYGSEATKKYIATFMEETLCPDCKGSRLKPLSLSVTLGGKNIHQLCQLSIDNTYHFIRALPKELNDFQKTVGTQALYEIEERLQFLLDVGLNYLTLSRQAKTLSGGEAQRIRLATQIGAGLSGVLYVLDEPSIGLHQQNNRQLIRTLCKLRDQGNTLIVVEHDEDTIQEADWVVDIGPGAGVLGGKIVAEAPPKKLVKFKESLTGQYLSGQREIPIPTSIRAGNGKKLIIKNAHRHNLKGVDITLPLGQFICVTGLSGSGKSTLVFDVLQDGLKYHFGKHRAKPTGYDAIEGIEHIDKVIHIDQSPIGRSPRSNPATYIGVFDAIRNVFAGTEDARIKGYKAGHFSFNVAKGRCEACKGDGFLKKEMHFLPDVRIRCEHCHGKRYNDDVLSVKYHGKTIADVLGMAVEQAVDLFESQPRIHRMLKVLCDVGLGYIHLGQPATTLSGGEAQRLKLASEFCKTNTGNTLYLLDEPTVGLHWQDLENLLGILHKLVDQGNTVVVIEHHLDLIKVADHLIDMGPEGGEKGGEVVAQGTPKEVAQCLDSYTGQFLQRYFS